MIPLPCRGRFPFDSHCTIPFISSKSPRPSLERLCTVTVVKGTRSFFFSPSYLLLELPLRKLFHSFSASLVSCSLRARPIASQSRPPLQWLHHLPFPCYVPFVPANLRSATSPIFSPMSPAKVIYHITTRSKSKPAPNRLQESSWKLTMNGTKIGTWKTSCRRG